MVLRPTRPHATRSRHRRRRSRHPCSTPTAASASRSSAFRPRPRSRGLDLLEPVVDAGARRGRDDRHRRPDAHRDRHRHRPPTDPPLPPPQIDPHIGFGHPQAGCERCMNALARLRVRDRCGPQRRVGPSEPAVRGIRGDRVIPARAADLDRDRDDVQGEQPTTPRAIPPPTGADAVRQDRPGAGSAQPAGHVVNRSDRCASPATRIRSPARRIYLNPLRPEGRGFESRRRREPAVNPREQGI